jgi:alginate O-acetyltransferase complex protein AlgI
MAFNSLAYAVFLPCALVLAWAVGRRRRWLALLLASIVFYGVVAAPYMIAVVGFVTGVGYAAGLALERETIASRRRMWLWGGIALTLAPLLVLKYTGFLEENLATLLALAGVHTGWTPPSFVSIGVSFYTFQGVSYLLDVYLELIPAERHLGRFAVYTALFAKVMQGPIERGEALLPQLASPVALRWKDIRAGASLFGWGLFKKVVVADRLAVFVATVYGDVEHAHGLPIILATYLFAAQIYFDFSGYTDMARGTAQMFGLRLSENFNAPYLSASIAEFWRRWHISFSTWILDYIFKPAQLSLRDFRTFGTPIALLLTFLLSGIWHGPTWCFVLWGVVHGLYMATSVLYRPWQRKLHGKLGVQRSRWWRRLQVIVTFHWVCLAWVFFRAPTVGSALGLVARAFSGLPSSLHSLLRGQGWGEILLLRQSRDDALLVGALILFVSAGGAYRRGIEDGNCLPLFLRPLTSPWVKTAVFAVMTYLFAFHGADAQSFIYAQF